MTLEESIEELSQFKDKMLLVLIAQSLLEIKEILKRPMYLNQPVNDLKNFEQDIRRGK